MRSPALLSCLAPLVLEPVPPVHALKQMWTDVRPRLLLRPEGASDQEGTKEVGLSPTMGRNSLMFPVRFPSMICQWNMS
jgi:hypothetical protein